MMRLYMIGGAIVIALGVWQWTRYDAVQDFKTKQEARKVDAINEVREIENSTRNLDDSALLDCLRGNRC